MTASTQVYPRTMIHKDGSVEHTDAIHISALKGRICTIIPRKDVAKFTIGLQEKDITRRFGPAMRMLESGQKAWFCFRLYSNMSASEGETATRDLMRYLWLEKYLIIWKQDNHGYEVNSFGEIKRKWELRPY